MAKLYTTIKDIEQAIKHHHDTYGFRISFAGALEFLIGAGKVSERKPRIPAITGFLNDNDFVDYIAQMPVDVLQILTDSKSHFGHTNGFRAIPEAGQFPSNKDVFAFKHIPLEYGEMHAHDFFEINYMYSGTCVQHLENEQRQLTEGDICIIPPFAPHNIVAGQDALVVSMMVRKSTFDKVFWSLLVQKDLLSMFFSYALYKNESNPNYLVLHTDNHDSIKSIIQNIMMESNTSDAYANNCAVSLLNVFFGKVLRDYGSTIRMYDEESIIRRKSDFSLLLQYIQHNYQTVTLQSLASMFHYNDKYLSKLIKSNMGKSFIEIIQGFKMKQASEALQSTNMKIHEIAELVGYDSVDHFSRTFKKTFGASPLEYRKTMANEKG